MSLPNSLARFHYWLDPYMSLVTEAKKKKNPSLYLYQSGARTNAFMLQGLSRIYCDLHNAKRFVKMKDRFKKEEDMLGGIDLYFNTLNYVKTNPAFAKLRPYYTKKLAEAYATANAYYMKQYFGAKTSMDKVIEKLDSADWMEEQIEVEAIRKFYEEAIIKNQKFVETCQPNMKAMEDQVHELRRKLRWLSIYPSALRGVIQYHQSRTKLKRLEPWITKADLSSPYNKFAAKGKLKHVILVDKNHFIALSHMIARLGDMKDRGLLAHDLIIATKGVLKMSEVDAKNKVLASLNNPIYKDETILKEANDILSRFVKAKVLEGLLVG